jgi:hypothetical protein
VDRQEIARAVRRRQVQETLEFEREREQTLKEQIEIVITEVDGKRVDETVYARMSPEDVEIVSMELSPPGPEYEPDPDFFIDRDDLFNLDDEPAVDPHEEELARLNAELEDCRRRQRAFDAYLTALDEKPTSPSASAETPG